MIPFWPDVLVGLAAGNGLPNRNGFLRQHQAKMIPSLPMKLRVAICMKPIYIYICIFVFFNVPTFLKMYGGFNF